MKRNAQNNLFLVCILTIFMLFTCADAEEINAHNTITTHIIESECIPDKSKTTVFELPSSLISIEESAFEGTAITSIDLPENVETIGDYAFANIQTLRNISIPNKTTHIGKNAFKGSTNVTITGAPKGYARVWAHENGIPFNPITSFYAFNNTVQVNGGLTNSRAERLDIGSEKSEEEKPNPTGRMTGELNAEKKEIITEFHIQGRSPPMA